MLFIHFIAVGKRNEQRLCQRLHRCQPSRNRAGNPAFWLISRIPAFLRERPAFLRECPAFLALFRNNKNR